MLTGLRGGAAAAGVVALVLLGMMAPAPVAACTAETCSVPFADYVQGRPVALYRFDDAASSWHVIRHKPLEPGCIFRGTFVFRRIDNIQSWSPATITKRVRPGNKWNCPLWAQGLTWTWAHGSGWNGPLPASLAGRWIVVRWPSDPRNDPTDLWHVSARGRIDSLAMDQGGITPDTFPRTLAGWYRAIEPPDTSTIGWTPPASGDWSGPPVLLAVAGLAGLALGIRPTRRRPSTTS